MKLSKKKQGIPPEVFFESLIELLDFNSEEPVIKNIWREKEFHIILPCGCVEVQHIQSLDSKAVLSTFKFCTRHKKEYEQGTKEIIDR